MREQLKKSILKSLADGQLTHTELCERNGRSLSTINVTLRELIEDKKVNKMRIGRNVYYALPDGSEPPVEKHLNYTILSTLSQHPSLTLCELMKLCPQFKPDAITKAIAKLVFTEKVYKHAKEKSRHMRYSTSNFVDGLLLVNPKRRRLDEGSDNVIGPFLRQFLFNLPLTD